jgi:peptidyl-prolyl cis-trans isomerase C
MAQTVLPAPSAAVLQALTQPFVVVNGLVQSTAHAEVLYREQVASGVASSPELRESVRQTLINQALMLQAAQADGIDLQPLVQAQMALASQTALVRLWQQKYLADHPITDEALQQAYQQQIAQMGPEELLIRHIVVADESLAQQLIQRIQQGAPMNDLATEHSKDPDSKAQGGLVGWVPEKQLVPEVAAIIRQMKPQQLWSKPVPTAQGWHVLSLQDRRPWVAPSMEKLRPQLLEQLSQKSIATKLQELRDKALIR